MAPGTSVKSHTTQVHLFVNPACRVKPEAPSFTDVFVHRVGPGPLAIDVLPHVDSHGEFNINPATLKVMSKPRHGKVEVAIGGSCDQCVGSPREFVYFPGKGVAASDSFTFTVRNLAKGRSSAATVSITLAN